MIGVILLLIALYLFLTGKFYHSLILFFLLLTNGFQVIPVDLLMAGLPIDKGSDLAIIYVLIILILKQNQIKRVLREHPVFKWCFFIVGFVLLDAVYSYFVLNYSLTNVIQVFRPYLVLLSFIVFFAIPLKDLQKAFNLLAFVTVVQSILFLLQIVAGKTILLSATGNDNVATTLLGGDNYIRYYNVPSFLLPALFYFLFVYHFRSSLKKYFVLSLLILTVIAPMHRSYMLAVISVLLIYTLIKESVNKRVLYLGLMGLGLYLISFVQVIRDRMQSAMLDLQNTFSSKLTLTTIDVSENTMVFRIGHLLERFHYITTQSLGWLFGIGLISDNSPDAAKLPFQIGLISNATGNVIQIDSGDLIWSTLFLNLGIVGTAIYIFFYIKLLIYFFKNVNRSPYAVAGFLAVLTSFFISFTGAEMLAVTFRASTLFLAVLTAKQVWSPDSEAEPVKTAKLS